MSGRAVVRLGLAAVASLLSAHAAPAATTAAELDRVRSAIEVVVQAVAADALRPVTEDELFQACTGQATTLGDAKLRLREELARAEDKAALVAVGERCLEAMVPLLGPRAVFISSRRWDVEFNDTRPAIGVELASHRGAITVVDALPRSPAERAGLMRGDQLLELDGQPLPHDELARAAARLRGADGSEITLVVRKAAGGERTTLTLRREAIVARQVAAHTEPDGLLVLQVAGILQRTLEDLVHDLTRLREARGSPWRGVVLDLRSSAGGLLDQVAALGLLFLEPSQAVGTLDARAPDYRQRLDAEAAVRRYDPRSASRKMPDALRDELRHLPMVVVTSGSTAIGAEMIAAALQDHRRARVVGAVTRGIGTIDLIRIVSADPRSAIRYPVAHAIRPSGASIEGVGVTPDVAIDVPIQDAEGLPLPKLRVVNPAVDRRADDAVIAAARRALLSTAGTRH